MCHGQTHPSKSFLHCGFFPLVYTNYYIYNFLTESEQYLKGVIFEDVTSDEKEILNLEYPAPSYTTLEVHSPASAASASKFPSGKTSSSGIIFNVSFYLFLLT